MTTSKTKPVARRRTTGKAGPTYDMERAEVAQGRGPVAGMDEVGRGPIAGPVTAAAVILDPADVPEGIDDSKVIPPARREAIYAEIMARAVAVSVGSASVEEITTTDIRMATHLAMTRAVAGLGVRPGLVLVDGSDVPSGLGLPVRAVVGGDRVSLSVGAASIVAKVTRDREMARMAGEFPGYGFERHAGYGTAEHLDAIRRLGPTPHHRQTFAPLRHR